LNLYDTYYYGVKLDKKNGVKWDCAKGGVIDRKALSWLVTDQKAVKKTQVTFKAISTLLHLEKNKIKCSF
jgi:hypothetical protein